MITNSCYIRRRRGRRLFFTLPPLLLLYSFSISLLLLLVVKGDSSSSSVVNSDLLSSSIPKTAADPNAEYSIKQSTDHKEAANLNKNASQSSSSTSSSGSGGSGQKFAPHKHHNNRTFGPEPNDELLVNTQNGYVRGRSYLMDYHLPRGARPRSFPFGRRKYRVNAWLGIPYAEPPINERRFKHPEPVKNWEGVRDATEWPNSCYQINDTVIPDFWGVNMWNPNTKVSEDCLYVNVWTSHPRPRNSPVLVWIYGGGFATGTSTLRIYDPRIIVAETNLIYVSFQYRVSLFGFFYMGHPDAPGNQGLMDQNLALRWIHNNIQYFGGDNSKITIFGESAGSVSVSLHLLSPLSTNLFRSAIMQSGTSLADWVMLSKEKAIERYTDVIGSFGCRNENVTEAMACARSIDAAAALEAAEGHFYSKTNSAVAQYPFLPVVDNLFLEEEPIILLNRGKFKKCPVLLGANKDEGNWFFAYFFPEYRNLTSPPVISYDTFKEFMTDLFTFYPQFPASSTSVIQEAIMYRYTNWNNAHNQRSNFENMDDAAGDYHFLCPVVDWANAYAMKNQDVYLYHYTHRSSIHLWPDWMGVMHGDEISFVFGEAIDPLNNYTYNEKVLARKMLKYWSNFVRFQNPNGPVEEKSSDLSSSSSSSSVVPGYNYINEFRASHGYTTQTFSQYIESWPKYRILNNHYDDYQRAYIILNSDKIDIGYNLRAEYCTFWGSFLPKLILGKPQCECAGPCLDSIHNKTLASSASKLTAREGGRQDQTAAMIVNSLLSLLVYQVLTTK